jgi:hypothetical protein
MKQAFILVITLFGAHICQAHIPACATRITTSMVAPEGDEGEGNNEEEGEKGKRITLRVVKEDEPEIPINNPDYPDDRSLIFIPEVYLNAHTLTFVTPCTGGVVEILQQGTVVYAETVTAQTMLLPSALQGTYELQLTWCGVTYKAEITL